MYNRKQTLSTYISESATTSEGGKYLHIKSEV